jgi:hypothetical protein
MKITREQMLAWLGSDVTMDMLVSMLIDIANGEYEPDALQKDVWCYQGEAE